jgi:hypothetical protein
MQVSMVDVTPAWTQARPRRMQALTLVETQASMQAR